MKPGKALTNRFDRLWRQRVLEAANYMCEVNDKCSGKLCCHHVAGRKNFSARWYIPNGVVLCDKHHTFDSKFSAHQNPMDFAIWILDKRGKDWWDDVMERKNQIWRKWRTHLEEIEEHLKGGR